MERGRIEFGGVTFAVDEERLERLIARAVVRGIADWEARKIEAQERLERDRETKERLGERNSREAYFKWRDEIEGRPSD